VAWLIIHVKFTVVLIARQFGECGYQQEIT